MPTAAEETAAEDDRLASLASAKKARAEKKTKAAAAASEKKQKAVNQAAAEEKRIAAVKKEKEASDARRANNINARDEAKAKLVEEKKVNMPKKARNRKPKAAAEEEVNPATTPAGAEDEAASAMWHAEEVAAEEGDEVTENEDGQTQPRDFTADGPQAAEEGENTNDEGGESSATSVDADENKEDEEGGEESEGEEMEESGSGREPESPENDLQTEILQTEMVGDGAAWWKGGTNVTGMSAGWWGHERAGGVNGEEAVADRLHMEERGHTESDFKCGSCGTSQGDLPSRTYPYHVPTTFVATYPPTGAVDDGSPHQPGWGLADALAELADGRSRWQDERAEPLQGPDDVWLTVPWPGGGGAHVPRNQGEAPGVCGEVKYEHLSTT